MSKTLKEKDLESFPTPYGDTIRVSKKLYKAAMKKLDILDMEITPKGIKIIYVATRGSKGYMFLNDLSGFVGRYV